MLKYTFRVWQNLVTTYMGKKEDTYIYFTGSFGTPPTELQHFNNFRSGMFIHTVEN